MLIVNPALFFKCEFQAGIYARARWPAGVSRKLCTFCTLLSIEVSTVFAVWQRRCSTLLCAQWIFDHVNFVALKGCEAEQKSQGFLCPTVSPNFPTVLPRTRTVCLCWLDELA